MRISDWSSDVCSSDLIRPLALSLLLACGAGASLPAMAGTLCVLYDTETGTQGTGGADTGTEDDRATACGKGTVAGLVATAIGTNAEASEIGSASCRERVCQYVDIPVVAVS